MIQQLHQFRSPLQAAVTPLTSPFTAAERIAQLQQPLAIDFSRGHDAVRVVCKYPFARTRLLITAVFVVGFDF